MTFGLLRAHVRRRAQNHAGQCHRRSRNRRGLRQRCVPVSRAWPDRLDQLRQAEVEHLDQAVRPQLDVGRLQIAMDDPQFVRGLERLGDLPRNGQRLVQRNRAMQRFDRPASDHRPVRGSALAPADRIGWSFLESVNTADVWMIE